MSAFILEDMALANFTADELLKKAEREENALAVRLYHIGQEEAEETFEENMSGNSIHEAVDYLIKCITDKSCWQKDTDGSWYLTALHRDTNVFMHRSEERRVGKECRSRWSPDHLKKKSKEILCNR